MNPTVELDLRSFDMDPVRGYLPPADPVQRLPPAYEAWEQVAASLSALLSAGKLGPALLRLPLLPVDRLEDRGQVRRALLLLSVVASAHVWGGKEPARVLPPGVAVPLWVLAESLGLPPILVHASMALANFRRLDEDEGLTLDNLAMLQLFHGGMDESWFYLVTVAMDAACAPAVQAIADARQGTLRGRVEVVARALGAMKAALLEIRGVLARMPEQCDPHVFYRRQRPFMNGWPEPGVVYAGVDATPRRFGGASGAQSPLLQLFDASLGVTPSAGVLSFLRKMRASMLPGHRRFLEVIEGGPSLRDFVERRAQSHPALCDAYNGCVHALWRVRELHREIVGRYILAEMDEQAGAQGTGGSALAEFLGEMSVATRRRGMGGEV
jgi:indoleamine 2,3-dioxygenase